MEDQQVGEYTKGDQGDGSGDAHMHGVRIHLPRDQAVRRITGGLRVSVVQRAQVEI